MKIKDFMTREVITVRKEMTVKELINFLGEQGISGAPVTEEDGRVLGTISVTDIIEGSKRFHAAAEQVEVSYEVDPCSGSVEAHQYIANEVFETAIELLMNLDIKSLSPDDTLRSAVDLFFHSPAHRLLVMEDNHLLGIVTTKDTLRAVTQLRNREHK